MTQEEKSLLLQDLCARLPYGVVCYNSNTENNFTLCDTADIDSGYPTFDYGYGDIETVKPYLRPMSSMTDDEKREFESFGWRVDELDNNYPWAHTGEIENILLGLNWLNVHHFDYRGLIEKGLAIEAPKEMYKID